MITCTQVQLAAYPESEPKPEHFTLASIKLPAPGDGQVLIENHYLSLDPYMRSQIAGRHMTAALKPGDGMYGETVGKVLESSSERLKKGDWVRCMGGWQSHSVMNAEQVSLLGDIDPPSYALSVLGMPGLTAFAGLIWQAKPKAGDTVLIPAATGAVGATAGQLAKNAGCKVIGIAGTDEKCQFAVSELGYDACINRKTESVASRLDELCPDGIDVFFDLVGGETLHLASERLAIGARVILCGLVSEYNNKNRMGGPAPALWIKSRATVYGLVVYDFEPRRQEFIDTCLPLVSSGNLIMREDIAEGIEQAPAAFCKLMRGDNLGKTIVKLV